MFVLILLKHLLIKDAKFARFSILPKIHQRLYSVPGKPIISNCGYYTGNFSLFLNFHLQPIPKKLKSYIKHINYFLKKPHSLTDLSDNSYVMYYGVLRMQMPNILHDEGLSTIRKRLNERDEKDVSTDTLVKQAELVLKNNLFHFNEKTLKQKRGTATGTMFARPYSILFMAELEESFLEEIDSKPYSCWRYIDDIHFI